MSSFGEFIKDALSKLAMVFTVIVLMAGIYAFAEMGPMDYIQSLPLFRLDNTDAGWFSICCAIYFIPVFFVGYLALAIIGGVLALVANGCMLFYKHVILEPMRAILVTITGAIIVWMVIFSYENLVAILSSLS